MISPDLHADELTAQTTDAVYEAALRAAQVEADYQAYLTEPVDMLRSQLRRQLTSQLDALLYTVCDPAVSKAQYASNVIQTATVTLAQISIEASEELPYRQQHPDWFGYTRSAIRSYAAMTGPIGSRLFSTPFFDWSPAMERSIHLLVCIGIIPPGEYEDREFAAGIASGKIYTKLRNLQQPPAP